jgi:hypothetical protein
MRASNVAIYILAALATSELSYKASAGPSFINAPETNNFAAVKNTATPIVEAESSPSTRASDLLAQATTFSDTEGNWAQSFIQALAARNIIQGFPDGTFRPDEPVTRAQFAAMIRKAFQKNPVREAIAFADVPDYYWASEAIQEAYRTGFLAGYPNNTFMPNQKIPRVQALVSLASGLNLSAKAEPAGVLDASFQDAAQIPEFARTAVAAATENRLVVNYPNVALLNPDRVATRADVAAFIYQALASTGQVPRVSATDVAAQYIVGYEPVAEAPPPSTGEQVAQLREQFRLPVPTFTEVVRTGAFGGSSIGSPTAFGADSGQAFTGISFQSRARNTGRSDGATSAGFGLGDARRSVGLEVAVSVVDLLGDTFQDGTVSFKAHRLLSNSFAVAVGVENAVIWGDTDGGTSAYGVASKVFTLRNNPEDPFNRLTVSLGVGSGRFRSEDDVEDDQGTINVFASAGLQATRNVSLIADWTGQDLNLGVSIVPFRGLPLVITPGIADVTGSAGDGARFILGIGSGISF